MPKKLQKKQLFYIYIFIFVLSIVSFCFEGKTSLRNLFEVIGPEGGGGRYEMYVTLIKKSQDSTLYPDDIFATAVQKLIIPLISMVFPIIVKFTSVDLNLLFFLGEQLSRLFLFSSIFFLCYTIYNDIKIPIIGLTLMLIPKHTIGYFYIYSATGFKGDIALAFSLLSLAFFLKERFLLSFVLNGISYNFHPMMPFYLTVFYGLYLILKRGSLKQWAQFIGSIFFLSLPFIFRTINLFIANRGIIYDKEKWLTILMTSNASHMFLSFQTAVSGKFWFIILIYVCLGIISLIKYPLSEEIRKKLLILMGTTILLTLFGFVFTDIFPSPFAIKMMFNRSSLFSLILLFMFIGNFFWQELKNCRIDYKLNRDTLMFLSVMILFFIVSLSPFNFVPVWSVYVLMPFLLIKSKKVNSINIPEKNRRIIVFISISFFILAFMKFYRIKQYQQNFSQFPNDWKNIQLWAKNNTAKEDVFITPTDISGFRVFSERANFINSSDAVTILNLAPEFAKECYERMELLKFIWPKSKQEIRNNYTKSAEKLLKNYNELTENDFVKIKGKYPKVEYIVTYRNKQLKFSERYNNSTFRIYQIEK